MRVRDDSGGGLGELTISVSALGELLVAALNPHLPDGLWLTCEPLDRWGGYGYGLEMHTVADGSWGAAGVANYSGLHGPGALAGDVEDLLDRIQEDVALASRGIAWPMDPTWTEGPLPRPWARVGDGVLAFGYGSLTFGDDI